MPLNEEDMEAIARLAKLRCSPARRKQLLENLNKILGNLKIIDQVDVEEMAAAVHARKSYRL